ncbi:4568_t:CDS:2 [Cetraspora pellucida]|uniref:4568_t:CDS:1 n=1 Tax=Cetraspora pellucida TaxID=1433469 RepID=A0A9N8W9Y9_9GLOM|nr:4568_t:CDS:2 [Cetraspora pellucida]
MEQELEIIRKSGSVLIVQRKPSSYLIGLPKYEGAVLDDHKNVQLLKLTNDSK